MRSGSVEPDKLGLALVLIKKRPERRSLIFLKFNGVKDVSSTIVSFKKTDDTSFIPLDDVSFGNPRIWPVVWSKNEVICFFTKKPRKHSRNLFKPIYNIQNEKQNRSKNPKLTQNQGKRTPNHNLLIIWNYLTQKPIIFVA
jgi:hypothetical protein